MVRLRVLARPYLVARCFKVVRMTSQKKVNIVIRHFQKKKVTFEVTK